MLSAGRTVGRTYLFLTGLFSPFFYSAFIHSSFSSVILRLADIGAFTLNVLRFT
jgi:hypothetical protein